MFGNTKELEERHLPAPGVGIIEGDMYIEMAYTGSGVDKNKSLELDLLLKKIKFQFELHTIYVNQSGYFSVFYSAIENATVKIIIPVTEIQYLTENYQQLKKFTIKWDANLITEMNKIEEKLSEIPFILEAKDEKTIPIRALMLTEEEILIEFLYYGRGMDTPRKKALDTLFKKINCKIEFYKLFIHLVNDATAVQIHLPVIEVVNQTESYKELKQFFLKWDKSGMETLTNYEEQILSNDFLPVNKL